MPSALSIIIVLLSSYKVTGLTLSVQTNYFEVSGSAVTLECNLDGATWNVNSIRLWKVPPNTMTVIDRGSANPGYTEDLSDAATAGIFRMTTPPLDWSIEDQLFQCVYSFDTASLNATRNTLARNSGGSASYVESTKTCVFTISEILPSPTKVVTHVQSGSGELDISSDSRVNETLKDNNDQGQTYSYRIEVDGSNMQDGDQVKFQVTAGPYVENKTCDIKKSGGLSGGAIAGIVIAVCVVVIAPVVIVILWKKKLLCFKGNKLGDLVWAKLERYPWWPGLVCNHPTELTHQKSQKNPQIHVQFFDDPPSRAWIKAKNVKEFKGSDHADFKKGGLFFSLSEDIQKGAKEADEALKLTKERRLKLLVALQPYDDKNMEFHGYKLGDLVWAKLEGYPWWPSLICNRPTELTHQNSRENPQIHVQFFDDPQSRAWIKAKNVREFKGSDHADFKKGGLFFSLDEDVQKGAKEADDALKLTKKGRLELVADMEFDDGTEKTIKTTKDKKIDRLSVVNEKAQKPKTPGHLTADTVASPKPRALPPIPEKEAKKEKKKRPKKKRKKTKNEDGGEDSVKVPSIEKKEKNMEHYTKNKKEYESQ